MYPNPLNIPTIHCNRNGHGFLPLLLVGSPRLVGLQVTRDRNLCPTSTSTSLDTSMNTQKTGKENWQLANRKSWNIVSKGRNVVMFKVFLYQLFFATIQADYFNLRWSRKRCETKLESPDQTPLWSTLCRWSDPTQVGLKKTHPQSDMM